jgi:Skp family chaperone for outer membrane proteins
MSGKKQTVKLQYPETRAVPSVFAVAENIFLFKLRSVGRAHGVLAGKGGFMKKVYGLLAGLMIVAMLTGCGGSSTTIDENKPVSQIAADASKMGKAELQTMVTKYDAAIAEKSQELAALQAKVKEIPLTELMGDKAKALKADISKITASMSKLKDQAAAYAKELAAKK